jgi:putative membrane protein
MMRWGYRYGMMGFGLKWLLLLIIVTLCVLAVVLLVRYLQKPAKTTKPNNQTSGKTALEILDEKYVNGEITDEEYISKKTNLKS